MICHGDSVQNQKAKYIYKYIKHQEFKKKNTELEQNGNLFWSLKLISIITVTTNLITIMFLYPSVYKRWKKLLRVPWNARRSKIVNQKGNQP